MTTPPLGVIASEPCDGGVVIVIVVGSRVVPVTLSFARTGMVTL